jgi:hypothetical protein
MKDFRQIEGVARGPRDDAFLVSYDRFLSEKRAIRTNQSDMQMQFFDPREHR